jgi:N-dimethylarginine dimethylaminohydrolase
VVHRPSISCDLPESLRDIDFLEVSDEEYAEQTANILVLEPGMAVMDARHECPRPNLAGRGFRWITVELDEITKVGGGVCCMTLPLVRLSAQ